MKKHTSLLVKLLKWSIKPYRIVSKELAVAAVAVLPVFLICGRRGAGAPLRAAVFILTLLQLRRRVA